MPTADRVAVNGLGCNRRLLVMDVSFISKDPTTPCGHVRSAKGRIAIHAANLGARAAAPHDLAGAAKLLGRGARGAAFEVTERTLRRDVDRLRDLGYPVQSTTGTAGGYSLGKGAFLMPLMLDDDEGVAVAVALHVIAGSSVSGIEDASQRAMAKLRARAPPTGSGAARGRCARRCRALRRGRADRGAGRRRRARGRVLGAIAA